MARTLNDYFGIRKAKDSSGHDHGDDGKFTSSSGKAYTMKPSAPGIKHDNGMEQSHTVHDESGAQVAAIHGPSKHGDHFGIGTGGTSWGDSPKELAGRMADAHEKEQSSKVARVKDQADTKRAYNFNMNDGHGNRRY
jgi:hypothetical protein